MASVSVLQLMMATLLVVCRACLTVSVIVTQVMVASSMASKLKPHQWDGVRFLYKNIVLEHEVGFCHLLVLNCRTDCWRAGGGEGGVVSGEAGEGEGGRF